MNDLCQRMVYISHKMPYLARERSKTSTFYKDSFTPTFKNTALLYKFNF